ncbi:SWIM zinc finger family protein [Spartinivicinus marinus]|uniref:SWIM zinc finger family protein n=1 Tax=Spartinivicinus marinus TaxID=2994442 RepID=UPI001C5C87DF|nr:SWIM zinc finger family protein [Spartinivicinus marinus]MCX4027411.1 SWIM zinc finger family protein [Spartinivicinus marinus]
MSDIQKYLRKLTIDDLYEWAGSTIVSRGKGYINYVSDDIFITEHDELVAEVEGSELYITRVFLDDENELVAGCSCPYYDNCKHAVALILKAGQYLKQHKKILLLTEDNDLYHELDDEIEEDAELYLEGECEKTLTGHEVQLYRVLVKKTHADLCDLLIDITNKHPQIRQLILENHRFSNSDVSQQVKRLRKKIKELSRIDAWSNHWDNESNIPDYSPVKTQLTSLLKQGHGDDVLQLGEYIWEQCCQQAEQANDEGETVFEIGQCLEVVLQSLPESSFSHSEQLLWVIERQLEDDIGLLENANEFLESPIYTPADWQQVVDSLMKRLKATPMPPSIHDFTKKYHRKKLLRTVIHSLKASRQHEKMIALMEAEVESSQDYQDLVNELLAIGEIKKARQWCIDGFYKTLDDAPGIAGELQSLLREMAAQNSQYDLVAAYRAQSFFDRPSLEAYEKLQTACTKAGCWAEVRNKILGYLETGQRPDVTAKNNLKRNWPLPKPEVLYPLVKKYKENFPNYDLLISIAIKEQRNEDVVSFYLKSKKANKGRLYSRYNHTSQNVAEAVKDTHPDITITIWDNIVESLIAEVKANSYISAVGYLRKMRKLYTKLNRLNEWQKLIERIRVEHKPKRRL